MAIQNPGKIIVLDEIKNQVVNARVLGTQDVQGGSEFGGYSTANQAISLVSQNPASAGLELENQVTFNISTTEGPTSGGNFPISIQGIRLFDASNNILFETMFSNPFTYSEAGTFTLTQYNISVD